MPYLKDPERRAKLWISILPENAGELNYLFTMISKEYVKRVGESYQTYNDIMGALEGAKMELYRRKISIYEDKKIKENGDVFD